MFTRPPFVISIPQPGDKRLTVTTPPLSETMLSKPSKARVEGVWLTPSIDIAKGEVWLPVGALTVTTPALSEAVNPTKERVEGAVAVPPSRDTFKGGEITSDGI